MRKRQAVHLLLFASLIMLGTTAQAEKEVFRWVDENGVVHFSDRPIDPRAQPTGVYFKPTDPTAVSNRLMREESTAQQAEQGTEVREEPPSEGTTQLAQEERIRKLECEAARKRFQTYTEAPRLYETLPGGERRYLSEEELDQARAGAEKDIESWCD